MLSFFVSCYLVIIDYALHMYFTLMIQSTKYTYGIMNGRV